MIEYYLKTDSGTIPPRFKHKSLEGAKIEAKRLIDSTNATKVEILAIVGVVEYRAVPVVEKKIITEIFEDLPF